MEEEKKTAPAKEEPPKQTWQAVKESWYDKIPLTQKHLDIIIGVCLVLLALTFVAIYLDAKDIFHLFGS